MKSRLALLAILLVLAFPLAGMAEDPQDDAGIQAKYTQKFVSGRIQVIYTPDTPPQMAQAAAQYFTQDLPLQVDTVCALGPRDDGQPGVMLRLPAKWASANELQENQRQELAQIARAIGQKLNAPLLLVIVQAGTNREVIRFQ